MDPVVASFAPLLAVNSYLLNKSLDGLSEEEVWRRPSDHSNPILWIAGHMTWSRNGLLTLLGGVAEPLSWGPMFERYEHLRDLGAYPPQADIVGAIKRVNEKLKARMEAITDVELSAPSPRSFPNRDNTVRGAIAFLVYHDTYHLGQIAYLRRWLGYPGVAD